MLRPTFAVLFSSVLSLLPLVSAQTPDGFSPSVQTSLNITYANGNNVSPAGELVPRADTARPPTISTSALTSTGIIFMIDLDVPRNNSRLTLLHWFEPNVTVTSRTDNTLVIPNTNNSGASYLQPSPPVGDIPHRYVFLLFAQPANFTVPSQFAAINPPASTQARIGFNINDFIAAAGLGQPLAANYIRVQNTTGTATATGSGAATGTGAAASRTSVVAFQGMGAPAMGNTGWKVMAAGAAGIIGALFLGL